MTEMKKANLKYPIGTIISFETGEYSDHGVVGLDERYIFSSCYIKRI